MDWKTLFLSATGRIGRQTFWTGFAIVFVASILLNLVPIIGQIAGLALLWPQVCIHAKRLHDMGQSAWLMLIPPIATVVGLFVATENGAQNLLNASYGDGSESIVLMVLGLLTPVIVGLGFLLWVGISPPQAGDNRFGSPPAA